MAYPTAAALQAASSGDARAALDALDASQLDALRDAAIVAVEEFCAQGFDTATTEDRVLDGSGGERQPLPARLSRLDSMAIQWSALTTTDVTVVDNGSALVINQFTGMNYYTQTLAKLDPDLDPRRRRFSLGRQTITVSGLWGWPDDEFPDEVGLALRYDMEDQALADANALSSSVRAYRALGIRDIRQGNLSATLVTDPGLSVRARRPLAEYVFPAAGTVV